MCSARADVRFGPEAERGDENRKTALRAVSPKFDQEFYQAAFRFLRQPSKTQSAEAGGEEWKDPQKRSYNRSGQVRLAVATRF